MPGGNAARQMRRFSGNLACSRKAQDKDPASLGGPGHALRPSVQGVSEARSPASVSGFSEKTDVVPAKKSRFMRVSGYESL